MVEGNSRNSPIQVPFLKQSQLKQIAQDPLQTGLE